MEFDFKTSCETKFSHKITNMKCWIPKEFSGSVYTCIMIEYTLISVWSKKIFNNLLMIC